MKRVKITLNNNNYLGNVELNCNKTNNVIWKPLMCVGENVVFNVILGQAP